MHVIAVANHKGGSGKTTTAVNLAACLSEMQYRVLLIDLDPQSHASLSFGIEITKEEQSIFWAMSQPTSDRAWLAEIALAVGKGLALVPSAPLSIVQEEGLLGREQRLFRLRELIQQVSKYDFVVIDCPPALGILTCNAFMACDSVLLPVETSFYAMNGVGRALDVLDELGTAHGHRPRHLAVATLFDRRTSLARDILEELRRFFRGAMLETVVRQSVHLREAASHGKPITSYAASSRGCKDYCELTEEFLQRIAMHQSEVKADCSEEVVLLGQMYGAGRETIDALRSAGFVTLEMIRHADAKKLAHTTGVNIHTARQLIRHASRLQSFPQWRGPGLTLTSDRPVRDAIDTTRESEEFGSDATHEVAQEAACDDTHDAAENLAAGASGAVASQAHAVAEDDLCDDVADEAPQSAAVVESQDAIAERAPLTVAADATPEDMPAAMATASVVDDAASCATTTSTASSQTSSPFASNLHHRAFGEFPHNPLAVHAVSQIPASTTIVSAQVVVTGHGGGVVVPVPNIVAETAALVSADHPVPSPAALQDSMESSNVPTSTLLN